MFPVMAQMMVGTIDRARILSGRVDATGYRHEVTAPCRPRLLRPAAVFLLTGLLASTLLARSADAGCSLGRLAEFPITMSNLQPLMEAKINGRDVRFLVDSGSFFSIITPASAAELGLATSFAPPGFFVTGLGGSSARVSITRVKEFTLAGVPLHNVDFIVGGSAPGGDTIGLLGQNVLHIGSAVEYDLSHGVVRLFSAKGCEKTRLAYWVDGDTAYSAIDIPRTEPMHPFALAPAEVNGKPIRVELDSGAHLSILSLKAAARAGVTPDSPGAVPAGGSHGIGKATILTYVAPFSSFKIGGEEIRNIKLRIADIDLPDADMLLGADFFLSHRIMVANGQHTLYFTYNGGPVFNLNRVNGSPGAAPDSPPGTTEAASGEGAQAPNADELARRAEASASRRQFDQALADLTRALELAPDNPEYLYQRATVHLQMGHPDLGLADLNQALKLKPDHVPALIQRAAVSLHTQNKAAAAADLDAASAAVPKESDLRFQMAEIYEQAGLLEQTVRQEDLWIDAHPDDARVPMALNLRCWARGLEGTELDRALKDCDTAIRRTDPHLGLHAAATDSRGLVYLRLGKYEKSIADYDAVLKERPKDAWAWYARGIDKLRLQRTAEGTADIAQATALSAKIADEFKSRGIAAE
jgi:tetratricopeptide (TPR) repeat protein/predicted aspartyl protease